MRKIMFYVAGVILAAAAVALAWGEIVASFAGPTNFLNGLDYYQGRLYLLAGPGRLCQVWNLHPDTGSVYSSFPVPEAFANGISVGEIGGHEYAWLAVGSSPVLNTIYQVELTNGSVVNSFPVPGPFAHGVAFRDAETLYHTDYEAKMLYVIRPTTGSIVESIYLGYPPGGLDYDPEGYLWIIHFREGEVCRCTLTGSRLASFCPVKSTVVQGVCRHGEYVWVSTDYPLRMVFKCYVGGPAVAPASLGRVKVLFR